MRESFIRSERTLSGMREPWRHALGWQVAFKVALGSVLGHTGHWISHIEPRPSRERGRETARARERERERERESTNKPNCLLKILVSRFPFFSQKRNFLSFFHSKKREISSLFALFFSLFSLNFFVSRFPFFFLGQVSSGYKEFRSMGFASASTSFETERMC
eukprot:Tamp_27532.p1 GENE.Tamp_27532~~Tamp_27532.p1  ORF type:complete len:162 (+),score=11.25 Tamp_27532:94-579(+)